ncbi:glutathione peroxidase [Oceanicoccus sp. KOV_DT_Chl]|uniref:glutathione peroxidase n=1 Tax=Oceanicoccus sp. KOV_DT_Chl TaxID=1904639 RepID=UPI000C7CCD3B|nr:glutathione peroxidase [Oceanicoccus sp. KOV_DT_Chl]
MNAIKHALLTLLLISSGSTAFANCNSLLDYDTRKLRSEESINLCDAYAGKVIVMVNTASNCGFTPQFKQLEQLHQQYKDQGLVVLGFPSNDFRQEHKDEAKTADVCYINYGVTFQMLSTSSVKGDTANPVFKALAEQTGSAPRWNFNKYVVNKDGQAIATYGSRELPLGGDLEKTVKQALGI